MRFSSGRPAILDAQDVGVGGEVQPDHHHRDFVSYHHPRAAPNWHIDMLVEGKSVWTEISGPSESRMLGTPVSPVFYISSSVHLPSPP